MILSRDISSMTAAAMRRVERGDAMPGLVVIPHRMGIGQAVEELIFLAMESMPNEWMGQILYLPL